MHALCGLLMSQCIADSPQYVTPITPRVTALVVPPQLPPTRGGGGVGSHTGSVSEGFCPQVRREGGRVVTAHRRGRAPAAHVVISGEGHTACRRVLRGVVEGALGVGAGEWETQPLPLTALMVADAFALPSSGALGAGSAFSRSEGLAHIRDTACTPSGGGGGGGRGAVGGASSVLGGRSVGAGPTVGVPQWGAEGGHLGCDPGLSVTLTFMEDQAGVREGDTGDTGDNGDGGGECGAGVFLRAGVFGRGGGVPTMPATAALAAVPTTRHNPPPTMTRPPPPPPPPPLAQPR